MIKPVSYKECVCDVCGAKKNIRNDQDFPAEWGKVQYMIPGTRVFVCIDVCEDCGEKAVSMIKGMVGGAKNGK